MRVLFITSYYSPAIEWGGPATCLPAMARGLKKLGVEITVATTNARALPGLPRTPRGLREVDGVPVHYFDRIGPARYFLSSGMAKYLTKNLASFDIVHVHGLWNFPTLLGSGLSGIRRKPYLITPHGEMAPWAMNRKPIRKLIYRAAFEGRVLAQAKRIQFTSEFEKQSSLIRFPESKTVVIPFPVEMERFLPLEPLPRTGNGNRRTVLSIIGRLHPVKGFDLLLPALSRIRNVCDFRLMIVGPDEGKYGTRIRGMIDSLSLAGRVEFLGLLHSDRLVDVYRKSDVIVVPSYQENFSMTAAESMASARPYCVE